MSRSDSRSRSLIFRRVLSGLSLVLFLLSVGVIGVALNYFSLRDEMRWQIDATKTRAYSLSEQTQRLLENLEGEWSIVLLMDELNTVPAVRRQIDEVLRRFVESAPDLAVNRLDPTDPAAMPEFDALIMRLQGSYAELVDEYDVALDEAETAFVDMQLFAQQQSASLQNLLTFLSPELVRSHQLQTRSGLMNLMATEADKALEVIRGYRLVSDMQPIPDYEGARSVLYSALRDWSNQFDDLALIFEELRELPDLEMTILQFLSSAKTAYGEMSQRLIIAADPLSRLEPLELSSIGRQIQTGECALIIGPEGAASIRSEQLFPRVRVGRTASAGVTFDRRFRGEQLLASTIRSMQRDTMPLVVFVHADEQTMFMVSSNQADLLGVKKILTAARFEVKQWPVSRTMQRPTGKRGQSIVWVIVPPTVRTSLEASENELKLIEAAKSLINEGESLIVNLNPSPLVRFGQRDPWQEVISQMGLKVDSSRTIFEQLRGEGGAILIERGQTILEFPSGHPIAQAVQGLPTYFGLPMPLEITDTADSSLKHWILVEIAPNENRWLEKDWYPGAQNVDGVKPSERLERPVPIVIAIQRPHPIEQAQQKCLVVSSGGWMLSYIADRIYSIGGDRIALEYPGNYELMLASVAWLAGEDELIAPSPISQEVARLREVTPADRRRWFWLTIAVLPGVIFGLGLITWFFRRF